MRIYLASRYNRHEEIDGYAREIRGMGHEVTSRWHNGSHDLNGASTEDDRERLALEDLADIDDAQGIVVFGAEQSGRGGYHIETGYALGKNKDVYIVGPRRNVFHYLRWVSQFDTWEEFKRRVLVDGSSALP